MDYGMFDGLLKGFWVALAIVAAVAFAIGGLAVWLLT